MSETPRTLRDEIERRFSATIAQDVEHHYANKLAKKRLRPILDALLSAPDAVRETPQEPANQPDYNDPRLWAKGVQSSAPETVEDAQEPVAYPPEIAVPRDAAQKTAWQDIATAPKDGTWILLNKAGHRRSARWNATYEFWELDTKSDLIIRNPTHWMPLPPPPPEAD